MIFTAAEVASIEKCSIAFSNAEKAFKRIDKMHSAFKKL